MEAVALAHGLQAVNQGICTPTTVDQIIRQHCIHAKRKSKWTRVQSLTLANSLLTGSLVGLLKSRKAIGSSVNPITKMFPSAVTERRFKELLDDLCRRRPGLSYTDNRPARTLTDFTIHDGGIDLPVNVKNAGTRFDEAQKFVGLSPDDCLPIAVYKAYQASTAMPNLIYAVSVDYRLRDLPRRANAIAA